ncbi:MAG: hypothetical protein KIG95_12180, partial [Comamonas sp.]|nr:hypothetical protein [Comamonas sp.]
MSIGKKIWLALLLIATLLLGLGIGVMTYINRITEETHAEFKRVDDRLVQVERWRGLSSLWL